MMNSYLKEENIIGCIDLNDNNEIRSNTLAQLKRFKKNISGKIEVILKKNPYFSPTSENHEIICNTNYFGLLVILWLRICAIGEGRLLEVGACTRNYGEFLNLYTLTSVFIISRLFSVHLLMC